MTDQTQNSITVTLTDLEVKYLQVLLNQAKLKDLKNKPINELPAERMVTLLESRKIYGSLYGYQYHEEKEMLPRLLKFFKLLEL